jgi:DNA-binding transcriptional LysR family regulator
MDLRKLRYFVVLAEELNFRKAAERLNMTQPPLSMAIRSIEGELDVRLFDRTPRRVTLTHAGQTFLDEARFLLQRSRDAVDLTRAADRGEVGRIAISFMSASIYTILPPILREFAIRSPGVKLELREMTLPQQTASLLKGDIDIAFLRPPVQDAELDWEVLMSEPLMAVMPRGHPLAEMPRVPGRRLASEPFVMFERAPGLVLHNLVLGFCLKLGFTPRVVQEVAQSHAIVGLVSGGIGISLVPASSETINLRGVEYRPLVEASPPVHTGLAWRRGETSPAVAAFRETAREVALRSGGLQENN